MTKEQIIYVGGKPHIKAKMVMLPSKKSRIAFYDGVLAEKRNSPFDYKEDGVIKPQNLYIISDNEIQEGDWVLRPDNEILRMTPSNMISYLDSQSKSSKKIIATTDTLFGLPQPYQQFIEKYIEEHNKGNKITDVLVEAEPNYNQLGESIWELKLDSQNQITIKKQKDSWTRD